MEATIRKNEQKSVKKKRIINLKVTTTELAGEKSHQSTRIETAFSKRATSRKSSQIRSLRTQ